MKRRFLLFLTVMLINVMAAFGQTKISGTVIFQDEISDQIKTKIEKRGLKSIKIEEFYEKLNSMTTFK